MRLGKWMRSGVCFAVATAGLGACGGASATEPAERAAPTSVTATAPSAPSTASSSTSSTSSTTSTAPTTSTSEVAAVDPFERPDWLGTRVLPEGPDGFGAVLPTPAELDPRRLRTPPHLPDPVDDTFVASVNDVPDEVLARSTWHPDCPVSVEQLRYVTVTFWGFDGEHHTGELLVSASVADDFVGVFEQVDAARFPIEEMRITAKEELDLPPTGDGNNTSAFVCRPVTGGTAFSQHAFGTAIDVNPFHNPYQRGPRVLPELASTYLDRADVRDGMLTAQSVPVVAFERIGWTWGGTWDGATSDPMHFSANGR